MKISELFTLLQNEYPHQYDNTLLMLWLNECEKDIFRYLQEFHSKSEYLPYPVRGDGRLMTDFYVGRPRRHQEQFKPHTNDQEELLVDEPTMYLSWLESKIDYANSEFDRYNNHAMMYSTLNDAWKRDYIRNNMPKRRGLIRV